MTAAPKPGAPGAAGAVELAAAEAPGPPQPTRQPVRVAVLEAMPHPEVAERVHLTRARTQWRPLRRWALRSA